MYSFEGDYRRRPQQNLAGASATRRLDKSILLQHAQLERTKREQQRRRHEAALKIQADARSFLIRKHLRAQARAEFDLAQQAVGSKNLDLDDLTPYVKRLLFFYDCNTDAPRLVWVLQHFLKHQREIKIKCINSMHWLWRLRWILKMCMEHNINSHSDGTYSMAIPLRVLETFTTREDSEKILRNHAYRYLESIFVYLIQHKYFEQLRILIDDKVPPMLESSPIAPTQISKFLLDMIKQPLDLISYVERKEEFSMLVLRALCDSILAPKLSDPIRMFIIPALAELKESIYLELIECINKLGIEPTINLFYSILALESNRLLLSKYKEVSLSYLEVLASMSSTIVPIESSTSDQQPMEQSDDSDSESSGNPADQEQADIQQLCIDMLNEQQRVHGILATVDRCEDSALLQPLCQLCHRLLIIDRLAVHRYKLLYMLAFKPMFLKRLWNELLSVKQISFFGGSTALLQLMSRGIALSPDDTKKIVPLLVVFCSLFSLLIATLHDTEFFVDEKPVQEEEPASSTGTAVAAAAATAGPDVTIEDSGQRAMPFTIPELVVLSGQLKGVCLSIVELAFPDSRPTFGLLCNKSNAVFGDISGSGNSSVGPPANSALKNRQDTQIWTHLFKVTSGVLRQLHTRDLRRQFCPEGHWIASNITIDRRPPTSNHSVDESFVVHMIDHEDRLGVGPFRHNPLRNPQLQGTRVTQEELEKGPPLSAREVRTLTLLRKIPFVVPFNDRVVVFQSLIFRDKMVLQGPLVNFLQRHIQISVRRNYLYEDAFEKLSPENEPELRLKMRVQMVNTAGLSEAGIDGGGLFREFLSELLKTSVDPNRGFFKLTKDNMLYPNPTVHLLIEDFPKHYYFIGRILGKALYENLLVELPFAEFFLSKIVSRQSNVDIHHLASLDPVMYRNLLYLKSYKGDVSNLGLDFTVLSDELGERRIDELKYNGANIAVTSHNRIEYIHLMADYKLNKQIRAQCYAFKQGIASVIPLDWLQMFNNKELEVLISGAQRPVDVDDLKLHTNYMGGYAADHPTITAFWKVVNKFNDKQKSQLLKFVTSCSRPPLLGFKELDPPFCIQHAGSVDRLPTSSTCMNLLKLPEFRDEKTLREKLLYAIQAGAGFELS